MSEHALRADEMDNVPECLRRDNLTGPYFPSLSLGGLLAVVALCGVFAFAGLHRLNHTDLWGHVDFGRWIAQHGELPKVDPFTATQPPAAVLNSAWLSQLIGYWVAEYMGNEALVFGHSLLVTLTAGALMLAGFKRGISLGWLWVVALAYVVLNLPIVGTIRPQLFGQLGAAVILLASVERLRAKWPLVLVPVVMMLWANLHGSVLMGVVILGVVLVGRIIDAAMASKGKLAEVFAQSAIRRAAMLLVLGIVGASINPYGPMLLVKALTFGGNDALATITEWRRASSDSSLTSTLLVVSVFATAALVKYSPRRWEMMELLLVGLFAVATFGAIRMLAWYAIVWPVCILPHVLAVWQKHLENQGKVDALSSEVGQEATAMRTLMAMSFVFATAIFAPPSYSLVTGVARAEGAVCGPSTPIYLADEVCRRELSGTIVAPLDWADFLLWKRGDELKPMAYGHIHLISKEVFADYREIFQGKPTWQEILRERGIKYLAAGRQSSRELVKQVLIEGNRPGSGVTILYQDQGSVLAEIGPATAPAAAAKEVKEEEKKTAEEAK